MVPTKTWLAIPALALACTGLGFAAELTPETAIALGALGAALAAAVRSFAGPSIAAAVAASASALLGVLAVMELRTIDPSIDLARAALAGAAAVFAISELVRPLPTDASPWPALGAALVASVIDPSYVLLLPIAGVRLMTGPWSRPRWAIAVPIVACLIVGIAVLALVFRAGALGELWQLWSARTTTLHGPLDVLIAHGDVLGPVTAVIAAAGIGVCAMRGHIPTSTVIGVTAGALAIDLVTASLGAAVIVAAALGAGAAIARFAGMIRWPAGQACVGAAVGVMLVVAPAWTLALG